MKNICSYKYLYSLIAFIFLSLGISIQIKAEIGQSVFNAFALALSDLFMLKSGTAIIFLNIIFFAIYIIIKGLKLDFKDLIQIITTIANGYMINLFLYDIFPDFIIETYISKILFFTSGVIISSISLGAILSVEISFPLENLCVIIEKKTERKITSIRMYFDTMFFVLTLLVSFLDKKSLYIREGTIISFILLSYLMGSSYYFFKKRI